MPREPAIYMQEKWDGLVAGLWTACFTKNEEFISFVHMFTKRRINKKVGDAFTDDKG